MIKLPIGVEINSLIDDLRTFSWMASDILLYYSQMLRESNHKSNIIRTKNGSDPLTTDFMPKKANPIPKGKV